MNRKIVKRILILTAVWLSAVALVYAAVQLQINNTATITIGNPNLTILTSQTSTTNCATQTGYTDASPSINWGSVPQGTNALHYACLQNTGSPHQLSVTNNLPSAYGTLTATIGGSPATGQTIGHNAFALVTFTWTVDPSAPAGVVPSFNISVS